MSKAETIKIEFKGNKQFKQTLVDLIYDVLVEEGFCEESAKPGCGLTFESTITPSDMCGGEG